MRTFIVIPCLDEADHIGALVEQLLADTSELGLKIVVADGGSTDATRSIVARLAAMSDRVHLLDNPQRLQSAAVNRAVDRFGDDHECFIRIDAHGSVPEDFCRILLEEADLTGADSVVCGLHTAGKHPFQNGVAIAQNTRLGNGGSAHRMPARGRWIDHGHHALMKVEAFRQVGGYDESFACNEDAELDHRLRQAGHRIWLTARTAAIYYPRRTPRALFRQYAGYGKGRARTVRKHGLIPRARQALPLGLLPAVLLAPLGLFVHWLFAVPALIWAALCLGYAIFLAVRQRRRAAILAGPAAMVMHLAWSFGFWKEWISGWDAGRRLHRGPKASAAKPSVQDAPALSRLAGGHVDIAVCTYRRPGLADTLASLAGLDLPANMSVGLIVADNDVEPTARKLVDEWRDRLPFPVTYLHAPARNISIARNACLEASPARWFAFIDDDETAQTSWLVELLRTAAKESAEAVLGPVRALYGADTPAWMQRGDLHATRPVWVGGEIRTGYTCNLLLDRQKSMVRDMRFDKQLGRTGGEDTALLSRLHEKGGRIAFAPDAWVQEIVPAERASLRWLAARRFRFGQTHARLLTAGIGSGVPAIVNRFALVLTAGAKAAFCFLAALFLAFLPARSVRQALRGVLHLGAISALMGMSAIEPYGSNDKDRISPADGMEGANAA